MAWFYLKWSNKTAGRGGNIAVGHYFNTRSSAKKSLPDLKNRFYEMNPDAPIRGTRIYVKGLGPKGQL